MARLCYCMDRHPFYAVGGANRQMYLLARELGDRHKISFTCRRPAGHGRWLRRWALSGRHRIRMYSEDCAASEPSERAAVFDRRYTALLEDIDADLYHARATIPNFPVAHRVVARSARRRKLLFTAAHWFDCTLEHIPEAARQQYADAISNADVLTCLSEEMKNKLAAVYNREVLHIRSGHPVPTRLPPKDDPPLILWLGRLNADWRRPELFVELARRLRDIPARCVMIGPGTSFPIGDAGKIGRRITDAAARLPSLTYLPGVLPGKDNAWIARASVLVNTSSHEGFPNTFQQSWLRRTPVASLNVNPDQVLQKHGLGVCTEGDLQELADTITQWVTTPHERLRIGERCRSYAKTHHDIQRTAARYASVYRNLLTGQSEPLPEV